MKIHPQVEIGEDNDKSLQAFRQIKRRLSKFKTFAGISRKENDLLCVSVREVISAQQISLLDVVDPIEHISRWSGCILGRPECSEADPCPLHDQWKRVRDSYLRMLDKTTIAELVRKGEPAFLGAERK